MKYTAEFGRLPDSMKEVIRTVVERSNPSEVVLFGSRARGDNRSNSDFDVALRGRSCSESDWNSLVVDLADQAGTLFSMDLVEVEKIGPDYRLNIDKEGKLLYG